MNKFFYLQMDSGDKAPVLLSANRVLGIRWMSATETRLTYSASAIGDLINLTHDSDASSSLMMQAFLVDELQKLLSTPATDVAPLLIPPVPITAYTLA
tara:strand:+ start:273 stop:566 length:294 start_codon:yes stop_codon:yes gene_type:complete